MKQLLEKIRVIVIIGLIGMSLFCILFGKPARADQVYQYQPNVKIVLLDSTTMECNDVEANGAAYALNTDTQETANGCWANYGEIYEIQLSPAPKVYMHYFLNKSRFEVKP